MYGKGDIMEVLQKSELHNEGNDYIEKSQHANHKYLRIENGKYIYDEKKMTAKDHADAASHHLNQKQIAEAKANQHLDNAYNAQQKNNDSELQRHSESANKEESAAKMHQSLHEQHKQLAKEKREKEKDVSTMSNFSQDKSTESYPELEDAIGLSDRTYKVSDITNIFDTKSGGGYRIEIKGSDIGINLNKNSIAGRQAARLKKKLDS